MKSCTDVEMIRAWNDANVMSTYVRPEPLFVRGQGTRLWDSKGKSYLDFVSGIAVCSVGHCHPKLSQAIAEQAAALIHVSNLYLTAPQAALAKKLCEISGMKKVFFVNTGAEACETALKIARKYSLSTKGSEAYEVITLGGSFHGRTYGSLTLTAQPKYQEPFGPMLPGVHYVPRNDIQALRAKFNKNTAAIFIEPLQGESGIHVVTSEYLQEARRLCDEFGALLVCDEVQCGMGRTGKWFGFEHSGVVPDLITMAKGLGGGVPIAAVLAGRLCADTLVPGDHGSTFAGNPLNATAALTVLDIIESENLIVNSQKTGEHLLIKLNELVDQGLPIVEVRGFGLMVAAELSKPIAKQVVKGCLAKGLILNATGDASIRILPALTITPEEIDEGLGILAEVLKEIN